MNVVVFEYSTLISRTLQWRLMLSISRVSSSIFAFDSLRTCSVSSLAFSAAFSASLSIAESWTRDSLLVCSAFPTSVLSTASFFSSSSFFFFFFFSSTLLSSLPSSFVFSLISPSFPSASSVTSSSFPASAVSSFSFSLPLSSSFPSLFVVVTVLPEVSGSPLLSEVDSASFFSSSLTFVWRRWFSSARARVLCLKMSR